MTVKSKNNLSATSYQDATGTIEFQFTNDYMFRAILQKYVKVLKGLICSLLHLAPESVTEITIYLVTNSPWVW